MEKQNNDSFITIVQDLAKIMGVELDITRPNDLCEFLVPAKEFFDKDKISLYDLINYLGSNQRSALKMAVALNMPYFIEKAPMPAKFRALARLECELAHVEDQAILWYISHENYCLPEDELGQVEPTTLMHRDISEFLNNQDDELIAYVIGLFQNKELNNLEVMGMPIDIFGGQPGNNGRHMS